MDGCGCVWIAPRLSTARVDSFVDAPWSAWIVYRLYPQPSTIFGDAIPALPRAHPQSTCSGRTKPALRTPGFMRREQPPSMIRRSYPHRPPALLLWTTITLTKRRNEEDTMTRNLYTHGYPHHNHRSSSSLIEHVW